MLIRSIPSTSGCGHRGLGRLEGNLKANDQELIVPVHVVYRFVDGKIASEYAHYDNLPLANALAEIAEAEEEAGESLGKIYHLKWKPRSECGCIGQMAV